MNFRMRFAGPFVPPLSNNLLVLNDDAADTRVGFCGVETVFGEINGACDKLMIAIRQGAGSHGFRLPPGSASSDSCVTLDDVSRSLRNRSISLLKAATSSKLR